MSIKNSLRPVLVSLKGKEVKGYFHRFVYQVLNSYSETRVLIELEDGRLRYFDPFFVQFTDRSDDSSVNDEKNEE